MQQPIPLQTRRTNGSIISRRQSQVPENGHEDLRTTNTDALYDDDVLTEHGVAIQAEEDELVTFDVFSLIVNQMIGTGIYNSPAITYLATGNKSITLGLWGIGFAHAIASMALYLDYAAAFPYTGGELVYLDEITAHTVSNPTDNQDNAIGRSQIKRCGRSLSKFCGDGLLSYVIYSILFVFIFNSATNSMQFGRMILLAVHNEGGAEERSENGFLNADLIRFIGIVTLSILCMIQWASPRAGRWLNMLWATVKIISVIVLIGFGAHSAIHRERSAGEWYEWTQRLGDDTKERTWHDWAKALLAVLFSFEGWENATFVASEIPRGKQKVLRRGFIWAVLCVGLLYLSVVSVFLDATPPSRLEEFQNSGSTLFFPPQFSDDTPGARAAWAVLSAISALGSINSIVYTFSRVKQSIGQAQILPWSHLWKSERVIKKNQYGDPVVTSPQGGSLLHWIMTVVVIAAVSAIPNTLESISIPGYLQTYAHALVFMLLAALFYLLPNREEELQIPIIEDIFRLSQSGFMYWIIIPFLIVYCILNFAILIFTPLSSIATDGTSGGFSGYGFPVCIFTIIGFGAIYYFAFFGGATRFYHSDLSQPSFTNEKGPWGNPNATLLQIASVRAEVRKLNRFDEDSNQTNRYGRRWRIRYILRIDKRHRTATGRGDGNIGNNYQTDPVKFWYWLFGGSRWLAKTPRERVMEDWEDRRRRLGRDT